MTKLNKTLNTQQKYAMRITASLSICGVVMGLTAIAMAEALPSKSEPKPPSLGQRIGIESLTQRLGVNKTPTGRGIMVAHVEGEVDGGYLPNHKQERFKGVHFSPRSGGDHKVSGHAHATAKVIYGSRGLAPGITQVQCYDSRHWMTDGGLRVRTNRPPLFDGSRVINCSWIAYDQRPLAVKILRRLDYLADIYDVIPVVGVDNGPDKSIPSILASGYNLIAVGRADGRSSGGETSVEEANRCKPDLVAPGGLTSFAVPVVSAAVARLLEFALSDVQTQSNPSPRKLSPGSPPGFPPGFPPISSTDSLPTPIPNASRAEVIKAVLLGGATKPATWKASPGHPLDSHLGAGVVNVDRSYAMLAAGSPEGAVIQKKMGWFFGEATVRQPQSWHLEIHQPMREVSFLLTWHRRIDGRRFSDRLTRKIVWSNRPRLADFDLVLYDWKGQVVAESMSEHDNVEHVYLRHLPAGRYELQVSRKDSLDESWEFALAWLLK